MTKYLNHALIVVLLVFLKMPLQADSIPEIVAKAKPAIVKIVVTDATGAPKTLGTGFFVSPDGLVVTNFHVVQGASSIATINNNGAVFLFQKTVAQPPDVDLAILKFQAHDVPFLKLGRSIDNVEGERDIVIGNSTGLTGSVSDGIISAFRENRSLIQITAPISQGSSGCPVMDEMAEVIGVATLENRQGQKSNFAIAVEKVSAALMQPPNEEFSGPALPTVMPTPAVDAAAHFDSGMAFLERQEYDKAINDFTETIRLDPTYVPAYVSRGNAYGIQGSVDKAINDFTEAIRLDPNVAIIYFNRGNAYYDHGNFDKASVDYNEAIRLDHNFARAYVGRGNVIRDQGNLDKAIRDYNEAIRLEPNYVPAYDGRGLAYGISRNYDKAISDFTEAIRLDPNDANAYCNRGNAYRSHGDFDKAIGDYNDAIRLDPNLAPGYCSRGYAYDMHGNFDKAISDYNEAIRIDPDSALAYVGRGNAYSKQGNLNAANADYATAKRLKAAQ
jgi:tetratricopeptide (TPR) repeat protein